MKQIKDELHYLFATVKTLDKKSTSVLLIIPVILTISWYYTSRLFFEQNLYDYFNANGNADLYEFAYWFIGDFFTLFILLWLYIRFVFKEKLADYGVRKGDYKTGLKFSVLFILIMIPFIWVVTSNGEFILNYPMLLRARDSWMIFIIFETGLLLYIFAWEFIWRGFMLFGLKNKFGYYAVLIQTIPFVILHDGKPPIETFGAIIGGLALGTLAYRTKSIYYCIITHAGVMFSIDFISTLRYRTGEFGIGINAILHVLKQLI